MKTMMFLVAAGAAAVAVPADAASLTHYYTLTGPAGGYSASWQLPSMPTPDQSVSGEGFALERVTGTFPGTTLGDAYLDFFSLANGGGLSISDADGPLLLSALKGAQLYSGSEVSPELRLGAFALTDIAGRGGYVLTVTNSVGSVPEPAAWVMMILGFGAIGVAMRTRRTVVRFV